MTPDAGRPPLRLLLDGPGSAARNMAVDEALLDRWRPGDPPVIRLYRWRPCAVSLGRAQRPTPSLDPARLRARGCALVRRPTGGLAVLHDEEVTYAVVGSTGEGRFAGGVEISYAAIASGLAAGLRRLGLDPDDPASGSGVSGSAGGAGDPTGADGASCFDWRTPTEISWRGRKLVGSAQRRRREAFLQHGSLPLRLDATRLADVLGERVRPDAFCDLTTALGRRPGSGEVERALVDGFRAALGPVGRPGTLRADEAQRAVELYSWKYVSLDWTLRGVEGARERRWGPAWST